MNKSKKKFYAVACGQEPGIYQTWSGAGGAQVQVSGYPGAKYKGFSSMEEAQEFMNLHQNPASPSKPRPKTGKANTQTKEKRNTASSLTDRRALEALEQGKIVIYTDGGCINNPGPGGYGVVLLAGDKRKELLGGYKLTTNNRMELMACIQALKALKKSCPAVLFSDSKYVVNGINKDWTRRWRRKGWMRNANDKAENADLWAQLLELYEAHEVEFVWVKGHAGNEGNERCDQLANQASADTASQIRDVPFETGSTTKSSTISEENRSLF